MRDSGIAVQRKGSSPDRSRRSGKQRRARGLPGRRRHSNRVVGADRSRSPGGYRTATVCAKSSRPGTSVYTERGARRSDLFAACFVPGGDAQGLGNLTTLTYLGGERATICANRRWQCRRLKPDQHPYRSPTLQPLQTNYRAKTASRRRMMMPHSLAGQTGIPWRIPCNAAIPLKTPGIDNEQNRVP